jgi:hypothetical protein
MLMPTQVTLSTSSAALAGAASTSRRVLLCPRVDSLAFPSRSGRTLHLSCAVTLSTGLRARLNKELEHA